jgi:hypothetical protein
MLSSDIECVINYRVNQSAGVAWLSSRGAG